MKILIADDNLENIEMLTIMLKSKHYETEFAENGREALDKLHTEKYDLIISDILMPVMDGFQLCRECKKDENLRNIPFIFYTATYIDEKDEKFALTLGARHFIRKPQEPEIFLDIIQNIIKEPSNISTGNEQRAEQNEKEIFQLYSERLVRKLEKKNLDLEKEIASRKDVEYKLKENEEKYRFFIEQSSEGIILTNESGMITECNKAMENICGINAGEMIGKALWDFQLIRVIQDEETRKNLKNLITSFHSSIHEDAEGGLFGPEMINLITPEGESKTIIYNIFPFRTNKEYRLGVLVRDITQQTKIENALKREQDLFNKLFDTTPDCIFFKDTESRFIRINNSMTGKLGLNNPDEVKGKTDYDFFRKEFADNTYRDEQEIVKTGISVFEKEEMVTWLNGKTSWVTTTKMPMYGEMNQIVGIMGLSKDITGRKMAEESIQNERNLLRTLIDNLPAGIFVKDKDYRKIMINPRHEEEVKGHLKHFGLDTNIDILGKTDFEVFPGDLAKQFHDHDKDVIVNGSVRLNEEGVGYYPDGNKQHLLVSKIPLKDKEGNITGMIGVANDITEQIKSGEALKASEEKFRNIFNNANDGMLLLDPENGKFLIFNDACIRMLGYSDEEFSALDLTSVYPDSNRRFIFSEIENIINNESSRRSDTRFIRKDKSIFTADLNQTMVTIAGRKLILFVFRDISERLRVEAELLAAKEKAEESDRLKTSFLTNLSHEVRTPMNGIMGFIDLLKNSDSDSSNKERYFEIINKCTSQLLAIITDIVEISKAESQNLSVSHTTVNISSLLRNIHTTFLNNIATFPGLDLELFIDPSVEGLICETDETKLTQVLSNLIANAIKFTPEGTVKIHCELKTSNLLFFSVEDTGIGIAKENHEIIFDRFRQVETSYSRKFGGLGLGLSIVKAYVGLLGGSINVDSKPGRGSEFYFTIPCKRANTDTKNKDRSVSEMNFYGKLVLIAEDDDINFEFLQKVLVDKNIRVLRAKNGQEAVEICRKFSDIDLVLMDVKMPVMDGYTATEKIHKFRKDLPVIAQTAYALLDDKVKALKSGCVDYLSKPIMSDKLMLTLDKYLA